MKPVHTQTASELLEAQESRRMTAEEIVRASLDRIERLDGSVKAFVSVRAKEALSEARSIDERRARGERVGRLAGIPVALKDNICTRGWETTCCSKMLKNFRPPYDATVVEKLRGADAILVGKTNMDEFAFGSSTENSAFFTTRNPWDLERVPGGSSGGSAAAVAAGFVPLAFGSETGGSVRQPAGFCGVVGVKPTYGLVSRYGLIAFGSSLDQISPVARDVRDAALLLGVAGGHDERDSTSIDAPAGDYLAELDRPTGKMRLGIAREYFGEGIEPDVRKRILDAVEVFRMDHVGGTDRSRDRDRFLDVQMPARRLRSSLTRGTRWRSTTWRRSPRRAATLRGSTGSTTDTGRARRPTWWTCTR